MAAVHAAEGESLRSHPERPASPTASADQAALLQRCWSAAC